MVTLKILTTKKDGYYKGPWQEWCENGQIGVDGIKKDGKWFGTKKEFFMDGKPKKIETFVLGNRNGEISDGVYQEWYENGQISIDGSLKYNLWYGQKKEYFKNGTLKAIKNYDEGDRFGPAFKGEQLIYDSLGNFSEKSVWEGIDSKGQQKFSKEIYANGKLSERSNKIWIRSAKGAVNDGIVTTYYPNGQIQEETTWVVSNFEGGINQSVTGPYRGYTEDGLLVLEGNLKDNKEVGDWITKCDVEWKPATKKDDYYGELRNTYENGKIIESKKYNKEGKRVKK